MPLVSSSRPMRPAADVGRRRRRPRGPRRGGAGGAASAATSAPRSVPTSTTKSCRPPTRTSVSARSKPGLAGARFPSRRRSRCRRAPAVDREHEGGLAAASRVGGIDEGAAEEDAVLDADRRQLAGAHAHEGVARRGSRPSSDLEAAPRSRGGHASERQPGGCRNLFQECAPDRVAEERAVVAAS